MIEDPVAVPPYRPRARKRGCVLKGCLTLFIVMMLMGMIIGGIGTYVYYGFAPFLSQTPALIRVYPATDAQYQAVLAKVEPFNQAIAAGTQASLDVTADDLDILIARDPAWDDLRGKVYLGIANNELLADVSTSADESEHGQVQLFFNGRFTLGASVAGGEFTAVLHRIETLSGHPLPALLARCVTSSDFAVNFDDSINRRIQENTALAGYLTKLRTATIENNRIHVTSIGKPAPAPVP